MTRAKAYTKYRDYYREDKYLGGLITVTHTVKADRLQDEVVVRVPKGARVTVIEEGIGKKQ